MICNFRSRSRKSCLRLDHDLDREYDQKVIGDQIKSDRPITILSENDGQSNALVFSQYQMHTIFRFPF